jgi:hypothetical protein
MIYIIKEYEKIRKEEWMKFKGTRKELEKEISKYDNFLPDGTLNYDEETIEHYENLVWMLENDAWTQDEVEEYCKYCGGGFCSICLEN